MKHIVVDLEMNSIGRNDPGYKICHGELIEIGAVMLDDEMREIAEYKAYVHPEYTLHVAERIKKLTGITDELLEGAPDFAEAFELFSEWCFKSGDDITFYEWSDADHDHFVKESGLKHIELSTFQKQVLDGKWVDVQKIFDKKAGFKRQVSLNVALYATGLRLEGELHDALDDARNTGRILAMLNDDEVFKDALARIDAYLNPPPLTTSIGAMIDFSAFDLPTGDE